MISSYFKLLIAFLFIGISLTTKAQTHKLYWQPETTINYNAPSRWSFNFKIAHRNLTNTTSDSRLDGDFLEFSHFSTYESGFYSKISLGLRYRNLDWFDPEKSNEYRITQQYSYAKNYNQYRLGHRLRFEQRFYDIETGYRSRYRLDLQMPLEGLNLNSDEFYLICSTESLYTISTRSKPELDQRITAGLGYQLSGSLKLQLSTEYRHQNYLQDTATDFFAFTSAIIEL